MKKEVSNKFKYFNFIFTLLIVLYHFRFKTGFTINTKNGADTFIYSFFLSITEKSVFLSMTVFFMMSAFLFYYNINNSKDALKKMKKRLKTLLIPYLSWTLIAMLFDIIVIHDNQIKSAYSIVKFLLFDPADGPLWYILALLIFIMPSPLIVKLKNKKKLSIIALLIILAIVELREFNYIGTIIRIDDWWWHGNMLGYIPAYAIGTFIGLNYSETIIQERYNTKIMSIIGMIIIVISIVLIKYLKIYANSQFYIYIIFAIGLWIAVSSKVFVKRTPTFLSCSFFIYAMHQPILIPIVSKITKIIIGNTTIYGYQFIIIRLINVLIIFIISWIIHNVLKKYLPQKIYLALSGGRE